MDIVVRTPHGDADVSIVGWGASTTLGDVIGGITGQAVPRLALVDGHAVDCATRLDDVGLLIGSIVTTEPSVPIPASDVALELIQVAGRGAGRIVRLEPGNYRIGPGRLVTAEELALSPVENGAFDLVIEAADGSISATIDPGRQRVALDGVPLDAATPWPPEPTWSTLTVGSRAFRLAPVLPVHERTTTAPATRDGTVAFSRPPRRRAATQRLPVVDAARDAIVRSSRLWERRADHSDAFSLPFGVHLDESGTTTTTTIDLADDRAVAIVGSERFRSALARTLLLEAVTLHGPADLDVVVLTSPNELSEWDWAKWLPHLRQHDGPAIWSSEFDIAQWAADADRQNSGGARPAQRRLVIVDDTSLWNRPGSLLRPILAGPPDDMLLLALCADVRDAPAVCRSVVAETSTGLARTQSFNRSADLDDIRPALTETGVATSIARSLAPLVDVDLPPTDPDITDPRSRVDLHTLIDVSNTTEIIDRWVSPERTSTLVIGRCDGQPVEIDADADVTVVVGSSMGDASDVAASWLLAQCADRSPDACWVTPLGPVDTAHTELLWQLPHATQRHDTTTPVVAHRLAARLRSVLDDEAGPQRILLVVRDTRVAPALLDDDLLEALIGMARGTPGIGLLIITDRVDIDTTDVDVLIRVERDHRPGAGGRRATIGIDNDPTGTVFTPIEPSPTPGEQLDLRPTVVGRAFTALERRIARDQAMSTPDAALADMVALLRDAADRRPGSTDTEQPNRVVVPPPLPVHLDLDELFTTWPGDGIPLGLADDPATGRPRPLWWQPGSGATLVFGSRRSGVAQVLSTIILGVIDRFAADDVRLIVIEPSSSRRRALSGLGRHLMLVGADSDAEVAATLDDIEARLATPTSANSFPLDGGARCVLMIGDLAQLRRRLADTDLLARLDAVLGAACADEPQFDVVAYASELAEVGPFADLAPRRLVGTCSDPNELATLGIQRPTELEGAVGRCRSHPADDMVQLAMPAAPLEVQLARRSIGGTL